MSNAFTNFLGGVVNGLLGNPSANMRDYQHASRLYVDNTYARAPKHGFLYFVAFNFNDGVIRDQQWASFGKVDAGLLVKKVDLPRFKIATDTLNQYNRKTVVQTRLNYEPISLEFHDDNSEITTGLWKNYYKYYYTDSAYGGYNDLHPPAKSKKSGIGQALFGGILAKGSSLNQNKSNSVSVPAAFGDTKYGATDFAYGFDNLQTVPFFKSIDIYVLHQQKFTQYTLVNPIVTEWQHDSLNQEEGGKILHSKMNIAYENVLYNQGSIQKGQESGTFEARYYDSTPSPLSIGGKGTNSIFGPGGLVAGASSIFGEGGSIDNGNYLGAALQTINLVKNAKNITKSSVLNEGYSILGGVLGTVSAQGNQPGGVGQAIQNGFMSQGPGLNIMINGFSNQNSSVNGTTQTTPSKLGT